MSKKVQKSDEEWAGELTPAQFEVCRRQGTEQPFSGDYWDHKENGVYRCACCGAGLFDSGTKFDSGTGWPSFSEPISSDSVESREDSGPFMKRTEVLCNRCDAHLGHVFDDGPALTGQRYCINSLSLKFAKK